MSRFALGIPELLRKMEAPVERFWNNAEVDFRQRGQMAQRQEIVSREPQAAAEYVVGRTPSYISEIHTAPSDQEAAVRTRLTERVKAGLNPGAGTEDAAMLQRAAAARLASTMNRGPMGGEQGILEGGAAFFNRPMVRRTGVSAAGLGAVAGTGALLTEGAQQLMTLMDFLQAGEDTRERAERSPLA